MFAADFDYYRADSVAAAGRLLAAHPGAKLLAGGHSLIPLLKLSASPPRRPSSTSDASPSCAASPSTAARCASGR